MVFLAYHRAFFKIPLCINIFTGSTAFFYILAILVRRAKYTGSKIRLALHIILLIISSLIVLCMQRCIFFRIHTVNDPNQNQISKARVHGRDDGAGKC